MAGIYLHIPFCPSRCSYCDFYSTTSLDKRHDYVQALVVEMKLRKNELANQQISTVYFGGGSPSTLDTESFQKLFDSLYNHFDIATNAEITVEANPDDLNKKRLEDWKSLPVNRLSVGIQSFNDEELRLLNRRHTAQTAIDCIHQARQSGFDNISIDLMYGLPIQTMETWISSIEEALRLQTQHISGYHLSYEPGTKMYRLRHKAVDEELSEKMFMELRHRLQQAGYYQYEISNYALPGRESKHNSAYWNGTPYLGLGAAAHSFDGNTRSWNVASIDRYIEALGRGDRLFEYEQLTDTDRYNERVMLSLRTAKGIDFQIFNKQKQTELAAKADKYVQNGLLCYKNNFLVLTEKGIFVSDSIIRDLME
ncbi:MAG: radical SAM family heme chaperone HemW [Paludibacteraceae bacterium]|nr:radical SAM family heme chaperone HemW [Paludibacteraceae bacterium]